VIESITKDGVAVLAMRHGKANALDTELCQALCGALDDAAAGGAASVVLTGVGTVFSAGVDLKRVVAGREGYVAAFLPELRRAFTCLATFELPVVAAVNGHAIAGGFILSAAADWAVMAEGPGRAGVTELLVGVPFPAVALELLRLRAGDAQARPLVLSGATFGAGEALARGLVDEAVPAAELASRSLAAARRLAELGPAFGLTKRQLRQRFLRRVHDLAVLDAEVDAIWQAPPTLERIRSFMTSLKISRDPSKASPGTADKRIGLPAFRSRSTTTAGPRPSREIRPFCTVGGTSGITSRGIQIRSFWSA
jgi:enoyl-CoA hydratase